MTNEIDYVDAPIAYLVDTGERPQTLVYPPSSGRDLIRPEQQYYEMRISDCRALAEPPTLDEAGFEVHQHASAVKDFYNVERVKQEYYPESARLLKAATGALEVFIFDHNTRSAVRVDSKEYGVRQPVDAAHNDYTVSSGPRRAREILTEFDRLDLADHRRALINIWRPIVEPVQDVPLAVCDARSSRLEDFVESDIKHFSEDDLENPSLVGQIYAFRYNPSHRWFYVSNMRSDEVMFLKCWDSILDGRPVFTGHTGFKNPACPADFTPRESIELRTLVVYPK